MIMNQSTEKKNSFSIENLSKSSVNDSENHPEKVKNISTSGENFSEKVANFREVPTSPLRTLPCFLNMPQFEFSFPENYKSVSGIELEQSVSPVRTEDELSNGRNRNRSENDECRDVRTSTPKSTSSGYSSITERSLTPISDEDVCHADRDTGRKKKARTAFTNNQIHALERRFSEQKYLAASERSDVASSLGLTDQQVKTWFQNRRMKEKRQHTSVKDDQTVPFPSGGVDLAQLQSFGLPYSPHSALATRGSFSHFLPGQSIRPELAVPEIHGMTRSFMAPGLSGHPMMMYPPPVPGYGFMPLPGHLNQLAMSSLGHSQSMFSKR